MDGMKLSFQRKEEKRLEQKSSPNCCSHLYMSAGFIILKGGNSALF